MHTSENYVDVVQTDINNKSLPAGWSLDTMQLFVALKGIKAALCDVRGLSQTDL